MPSRILYRLGAKNQPDPVAPDTCDWPYGVDYEPAKAARPFLLWEGRSPTEVGGEYSAREILASAVLREHLALAGTAWLQALLERLANGEAVSQEQILTAHALIHQQPPEVILLAGSA